MLTLKLGCFEQGIEQMTFRGPFQPHLVLGIGDFMIPLPTNLAFLMIKLCCLNNNSTQRPGHWPASFSPCSTGPGVTWAILQVFIQMWTVTDEFLLRERLDPKWEREKPKYSGRACMCVGQTGAGVRELQQRGCGTMFYTYSQEWSCTRPLRHLTLRSIMSFSYLENDIAAGFKRMICKCGQSRLIRAPASLYQLSNKADGFGQQTCR